MTIATNITKSGQFLADEIEEYFYELDGSVWKHVFHHNAPNINLFSSSDDFEKVVYSSPNTWLNFNVCNKISGNWEFLVIQWATENSPTIKYRWSQTENPFTATSTGVAAANITKNTSEEYSNFTSGGLYKLDSNSYFSNNSGAMIGAWASSQQGVLGWNNLLITSGCINIYVRIDSIDYYANVTDPSILTGIELYEY